MHERRFSIPGSWRHYAGVVAIASATACTGRGDSADTAAHPDTMSAAPRHETACTEIAQAFRALPSGRVEQATDSFPSFSGSSRRYGCVVRGYGPLRKPVTVEWLDGAIVNSLGTRWRADSSVAATGQNGTVYGLWRDDVLCLFRINWNSSELPDSLRSQELQYIAEIGCEPLPDRVVPRG